MFVLKIRWWRNDGAPVRRLPNGETRRDFTIGEERIFFIEAARVDLGTRVPGDSHDEFLAPWYANDSPIQDVVVVSRFVPEDGTEPVTCYEDARLVDVYDADGRCTSWLVSNAWIMNDHGDTIERVTMC